jgi:hypothetical protein
MAAASLLDIVLHVLMCHPRGPVFCRSMNPATDWCMLKPSLLIEGSTCSLAENSGVYLRWVGKIVDGICILIMQFDGIFTVSAL